MLEFTSWYVVVLANFVILVFILNLILFKPLLKIFKQRQDIVNEAIEKSKHMNARKEEAMDVMKKGLEQARAQAKEIYEALRAEGLDRQKDLLTKAHHEALEFSEKIKGELKAETDKARRTLRDEVEKFSDSIIEKLVRT